MSTKDERELCIEFARKFLSKDSTPLQVETLASLLVSVRAAAPPVEESRCPHCGVPLTGMNANPDECLHKPAMEDALREVDWSSWFCDAHRPIQSHAKGMCFVCNALKLMREGEDICEHGVEAGEHCSVCGTLSNPGSRLFSHVPQSRSSNHATPLRDALEEIVKHAKAFLHILNDEEASNEAELDIEENLKQAIVSADAALRATTPEPREATGELESWVRLVPHVGHKEFKGSFESTTEFEPFCARCNLEKLTQGPTIREVCKGRDRTGQP